MIAGSLEANDSPTRYHDSNKIDTVVGPDFVALAASPDGSLEFGEENVT